MKNLESIFRFLAACVVAAVLACGMISASAEELSEADMSELFTQGKDLFRQANELAGKDAAAAHELYQKAALRFERITREGGVQNGKLYYNIGNAYFRMNDLGRAILNYRKAQQLIPNDPNLRQNLDFARLRRVDKLDVKAEEKVMRTLFFWHYDVPSRIRSVIFGVGFTAFWAAAAVLLFVRRPFLSWVQGIGAVIAILMLGSLLVESSTLKNAAAGVILAKEVVARKGDSTTYEASFKEPLHAGTEFTVVEDRGDWVQVELTDARRCWLPAKSIGLVRDAS